MRASWSITAQKNKGIKKRVTSAVVEGWKKISDKNKGRVMSDTWRENLSIGISATYKQRRMTRHQGKFKPSNPKKYKGDCTNIIYRSMWECNFMLKLDRDPKVVRWSSEEIIIQYRNPITGRISRYFPDFYVERLTEDGSVNKFLVEIKPKYQTLPPPESKRKTKAWQRMVLEYAKNQAKWEAAKKFCSDRKYTFTILTEEDGVGL
jgi:hypothetical protein